MTVPTTTPEPGATPKRQLSDAELAQRRNAAAQSTGPRTDAGKARSSRNAWKHGLSSAVHKAHFGNGLNSLIGTMGKPCQTTCPVHPDNPNRTEAPCSLVTEGLTQAGGNCMERKVYVDAFAAIMDAVENQSMDGMNAMMASEVASTLQMLHELKSQVTDLGPMIGIPMLNADGQVVTRADGSEVIGKYVPNPGWPIVLKTLEVLKIDLSEMLTTPKSQSQAKLDVEKVDAMQTLLGGIFQRGAAARGALPPPRDPEAD
ncbi:MAG: hypothetical protein ACREPV_01110 [Lysobacter sp.]